MVRNFNLKLKTADLMAQKDDLRPKRVDFSTGKANLSHGTAGEA